MVTAAGLIAPLSAHSQPAKPVRPEIVVRSSSYGTFFSVSVSPNGKWYAVLSVEGHVGVFSTADGTEYRSFQAGTTGTLYTNASISHDSKNLALPAALNKSGKSQVGIFDVETAHPLPSILFEGGFNVTSVAYHPSEDILAAALSNGDVFVVRATNGDVLFTAGIRDGLEVEKLHFSADGEMLLGITHSEARLWNWRTGKQVWVLDSHMLHSANLHGIPSTTKLGGGIEQDSAEVLRLYQLKDGAFSPSGRELALVHYSEVSLVNAADGSKLATIPLRDDQVFSVLFLDENRVFIGKSHESVIYDLAKATSTTYPAEGVLQAMAIPFTSNLLLNLGGRVGIRGVAPGPWISFAKDKLLEPLGVAAFSPDSAHIFAGVSGTGNISDWNLESGENDTKTVVGNAVKVFAQSADGKLMAFYREEGTPNDKLHLWSREEHREIASLPIELLGSFSSVAFSPNGRWLACIAGGTKKLHLWSLPSLTPLPPPDDLQFSTAYGHHDGNLAFSPDSTLLAITSNKNVVVYSMNQHLELARTIPVAKENILFAGTLLSPQAVTREVANTSLSVVAFSPDGRRLAVLGQWNAHVFDTTTWSETDTIPNTFFPCLAFSPDSQRLAVMTLHDALALNPGDSLNPMLTLWDLKARHSIFATDAAKCPASFNKEGSLLLAGVAGGLGVFRPTDGALLASLYRFKKDGSSVQDDAPDWLVVTPNGLFDGTPAAWNSLSWRFEGNTFDVVPVEKFFREFFRPGLLADIAAGREIQPPPDIATIDRRQPQVKLRSPLDLASPQTGKHVPLELQVSESREPSSYLKGGSGVRDLRLFRNGTLVKVWRGDLPLDRDGRANFQIDVPIGAGENRFTAYVFNHADIKSSDATLTTTGAPSLHRQGTAYVLAIGINSYAANSDQMPMNLNFAENDADDFKDTFARDQDALRQFSKVKTIALLSRHATRKNILAALELMGGSSRDTLTPDQQTLLKDIDVVRPEDGVFMFYAGHGAMDDTHFYLLPADFNPSVPLSSAASHSISETDLGQVLEAISPERSFLIIDACHSGKAIDAKNVGPMNSTGLAQLAYEKGMYILAASQGIETALEVAQLGGGHGYLTFALVEEGLKTKDAAQNGIVELRPWFEYASHRVPNLQGTFLYEAKNKGRVFVLAGSAGSVPVGASQHPRVFYRREPEVSPFVVAKPEAK
jgi:WD40 repeat protein